MDAETIQDYQQHLQGAQVAFTPFNSVIGYRPSGLATAGRGVSSSYAANLLFLTNLDSLFIQIPISSSSQRFGRDRTVRFSERIW